MLMKLPPETELDTEAEVEVDVTCADPYFSPGDTKRIAAIIQSYVDGVDHEGVERFRELVEFGFPYATENIGEVWIEIDGVTVDEFLADHRRVLTTDWDDLACPMYCHTTGRHYLRVVYDWRPSKLEYVRAMIDQHSKRGDDIVYLFWPSDVPKPVPGMTMNEFNDKSIEVQAATRNQQRGRGFAGYLTNLDLISFDAKKKEKIPRTLTEILTEIRKAFGGYPYRVGEMLFVPDGGSGETWGVHFLTNVDSLFSWFQRFGRVEWDKGVGFVTPKQLYEELLRSAPAYDTIESVPHEPPIPRAYYSCEVPRDGDGSALEGLLDRFSPASEQDRQLIKSLFLTAFWGGPPGARPAFLITSPFGRGMGKTTVTKMLARLVGVGEIFDVKPREDIGTIKQRLLTPTARKYRLATLDNLKSLRFSWDDLESLITTPVISGKQMYYGESQRPNYLTWILTVNGASFTRDMAQRVVTIELDKPHHTGTWESDTERYIDEHRREIIADIVTTLRARPPKLAKATRWGTWDAQILARLQDPETIQRLIVERQCEIDVEDEEAGLIHEAIANELWRRHLNPDESKVFLPSKILADLVGEALGEKVGTTGSSRRLKQMIAEGTLKNLEENKTKSRGRGFVWCGDEARDKPCVTLAVPDSSRSDLVWRKDVDGATDDQ